MIAPVIGIIGGRGRMGRHFAKFFRNSGISVLVSDKGTKFTNIALAQKSDIVIVSVPIDQTSKVIAEILPHLKKLSAIMDLTSIKEVPIRAMLKGNCEVLGMHPMFGNSNPIPGQTIIICPTKKSGPWSLWMENFFRQNKVHILKMSAPEHDQIMNVAQGLIHFAEITFADSVRRMKMPINELLKYTGKASELKVQLAARLIDQSPELYGNIQIQNPHALKSLKEYKKSVDELYDIVQKKDLPAFIKYFRKTREFFGPYSKKAYDESSYLIDQLLALRIKAKLQKTITPTLKHLAVLGPENTFSDLAAIEYLQKSRSKLQKYFAKDIDEVFELVGKGKVREGIVPVENKLHGTVRETLDNLFEKNVHIVGEINVPIHHALITSANSKKSDIKKIISHSQALNQCKNYLKKSFPKATKEDYPSTAAAVSQILRNGDTSLAAIAPAIAAQHRELKILAANIEDHHDNTTAFLVIKKGQTPYSKDSHPEVEQKNSTKGLSKISIAFYFSKDRPGSLFEILKSFSEAEINLTKIESRPTKASFGDYIFYLDFHGSLSDAKIRKVLKIIEKQVAELKILGNY